MGVTAKAHLIYGYKVNGERMRKIWHNISENEYERLVDGDLDCEAIYGYDGIEYLGYEIKHANEDEDAAILSEKDIVSQELKDKIKQYAARVFNEPDIADPQYLLVCLCH